MSTLNRLWHEVILATRLLVGGNVRAEGLSPSCGPQRSAAIRVLRRKAGRAA